MTSLTFERLSLTRPPRDDDELWHLVKALWGVEISRAKVCPEHDAPFDWFADSFFARQPQTIALGSRGLSGKSLTMANLGLTQAVVLGSETTILGGSGAQSQNLHTHMRNAWESPNAPRYMLADESAIKIELTNKAIIRPLTASQKTVRGPHPQRLLLDEVDEIKQDIFDAAKGQPMPQKNWLGVPIPAQTAMTSTLQYADGTMMKEMKRFAEVGMKTHSWCYRENLTTHGGWLSPEFVEQKKLEMPAEMWRVEYELGEPSIGNRAFDHEAIERTFEGEEPKAIIKSKRHQEYQIEEYNPSVDYVIAADWAKTQDYTVITVWKATSLPMQLVYYVRMNRQPYPQMIQKFNQLQKRYYAEGIHDATGLGGVVADLIDGQVWNFQMTGRQRDDMLSEYVAAVENDQVKAPRITDLYLEHKYASWEDLFSRSQEYHLPDTVCSAALAWKVVGGRFPATAGIGLPKVDSNWMSRAVERNSQQQSVNSTWRPEGQVRSTKEDELTGISLMGGTPVRM